MFKAARDSIPTLPVFKYNAINMPRKKLRTLRNEFRIITFMDFVHGLVFQS